MSNEQGKPQQHEQAEFEPKNVKFNVSVTPPDCVPEDPDEAEALRIKMLSLQHLNIVITE